MNEMNPRYDLVVVGGGSAGSAAAIAAARLGLRVLLVERYGSLGGTGTNVLDSFYGFFTPGSNPRQVVGGIGWEVVQALDRAGAMIMRPSSYGAGAAVTYNPDILKCVWDDLVLGSDAHLLLHTLCTGAHPHAWGWTVDLATRTDARSVETQWLIDAGGDAQIAAWAGADWEPLDRRTLQSLTTTFRMVNVDDEQARTVSHADLVRRMEEAAANGYALPRQDGSIHHTPTPGTFVANMTRVKEINPLIPEELSAAEIEGRRQSLEYVRFLRNCVPGYADAQLGWLSTQIGVRESRRIVGEYTLTRDDVLQARHFSDGIALCGAPIEDHGKGSGTTWEYLPEGATVAIPLRCLIPHGVDRLLVAGRCLSASHQAHAAVRSMGQCMAMGQAAGTAVAQSIETKRDVRDLDLDRLHATLVAAGVILE